MLGASAPALLAAEGAPATWDDLQLAKSGKYSRLYLLPGADFQPYNKIMLDPTEASFRKDWVRNYNQSSGTISRRISDEDVNRVIKSRLRTNRVVIVAVTKDGEAFKKSLASDDPSPMTYNSPKPQEITDEDKLVVKWPLGLKLEDIKVRPVAEVFQ